MLKHRSHNCLIQVGTDEVRAENVTQVPSVVITTQYSDTWPYPQFVIIPIRWEPSSAPTSSEKLESGADIAYTDKHMRLIVGCVGEYHISKRII